jgi:uncharacterized protein (DUF1684 family)
MASRTLLYTTRFLSVVSICFLFSCNRTETDKVNADPEYVQDLRIERLAKDKELVDDSILEKDLITDFKGLNYFPADSNYVIRAKMSMLPPIDIQFSTTTDRKPIYQTFCTLEFKVGDSLCRLIAYTSGKNMEHGLFIPFKDGSNKTDTYKGGRYIEMPYNGEKDYIELDFNRAFNPYCHYNHDYSCPLVPEENVLQVAINAGEKKMY